ncbi:MAG: hypothetical protein ABIU09_13535 [Pyrinomonadaceae bacterium]
MEFIEAPLVYQVFQLLFIRDFIFEFIFEPRFEFIGMFPVEPFLPAVFVFIRGDDEAMGIGAATFELVVT